MTGSTHPSVCYHTQLWMISLWLLRKLGKGALLAKVDIESAYCLIPAHPQEHPLQAGIAISTLTPLALAQH